MGYDTVLLIVATNLKPARRGFFLRTQRRLHQFQRRRLIESGGAVQAGAWRTANARHAPLPERGEASNNHPWLPGLLPLSLEYCPRATTYGDGDAVFPPVPLVPPKEPESPGSPPVSGALHFPSHPLPRCCRADHLSATSRATPSCSFLLSPPPLLCPPPASVRVLPSLPLPCPTRRLLPRLVLRCSRRGGAWPAGPALAARLFLSPPCGYPWIALAQYWRGEARLRPGLRSALTSDRCGRLAFCVTVSRRFSSFAPLASPQAASSRRWVGRPYRRATARLAALALARPRTSRAGRDRVAGARPDSRY